MLRFNEKEGVEEKEKLKRYDLTLLRKSKLNPRKTSEELKRDMDDSGVHVSSSTVRRRLLEKGRKARRPKKEATVNRRDETETIQLGKKTQRLV